MVTTQKLFVFALIAAKATFGLTCSNVTGYTLDTLGNGDIRQTMTGTFYLENGASSTYTRTYNVDSLKELFQARSVNYTDFAVGRIALPDSGYTSEDSAITLVLTDPLESPAALGDSLQFQSPRGVFWENLSLSYNYLAAKRYIIFFNWVTGAVQKFTPVEIGTYCSWWTENIEYDEGLISSSRFPGIEVDIESAQKHILPIVMPMKESSLTNLRDVGYVSGYFSLDGRILRRAGLKTGVFLNRDGRLVCDMPNPKGRRP